MRKNQSLQERNRQSEQEGLNRFRYRRSCFAYGTLIATPEGMSAIENIKHGDPVLVGTPRRQENELQLSWSPKTVAFSAGARGPIPLMIHLQSEDEQEYVITPDHLFLMPSGDLTRADRLRPGDQLVRAEGGTMLIALVSAGAYEGGIHNIACDVSWNRKITGHLLNASGVVSGDYTSQLYHPSNRRGPRL